MMVICDGVVIVWCVVWRDNWRSGLSTVPISMNQYSYDIEKLPYYQFYVYIPFGPSKSEGDTPHLPLSWCLRRLRRLLLYCDMCVLDLTLCEGLVTLVLTGDIIPSINIYGGFEGWMLVMLGLCYVMRDASATVGSVRRRLEDKGWLSNALLNTDQLR